MKPVLMTMIGLLAVSMVISLPAGAGPGEAGTTESSNLSQRQATPLATGVVQPDILGGDPLDGDPLDGDPALNRPEPPAHVDQFAIQRSGRPKQASSSLPAYDDDPNTYWTPTADGERSWLWLDLGTERRLRWLRVLSRGSGSISVELSSDLNEWQPEAQFDAGRGWHALELQNDARYVRLNLQGDAGNEAPAIGEINVYGSNATDSVALERAASHKSRHKKHRAARGVVESQQAAATTDESANNSGKKSKSGGNNGGNIQVSAKQGKTDCQGKHASCKAKEGRVDVNTDCPGNGNCTITAQADGGTATCDTTSGDKNRSGGGEGKHNGNGGRCESVANGGAITIGDVNP
jgi:F5/8 type C domain